MIKNKIGLTFGVFDLFHIGHLNLLMNAKKYCDELIVCVSTDKYSKEIKGYKPIIRFSDRMRIINAIECVDEVGIQDVNCGKKEAVAHYKPDILFVGSDWDKNSYSGEGLGVKVEYLRHTNGVSTTKIKEKICQEVVIKEKKK